MKFPVSGLIRHSVTLSFEVYLTNIRKPLNMNESKNQAHHISKYYLLLKVPLLIHIVMIGFLIYYTIRHFIYIIGRERGI